MKIKVSFIMPCLIKKDESLTFWPEFCQIGYWRLRCIATVSYLYEGLFACLILERNITISMFIFIYINILSVF
jgi:hypothetical protein